ncbi:MAG: helix-turn-helix transcriptional regulator [Synergistaceae bacterium]|nr:helix-turn-helix transcriptional regulator [Synergistaceae bacterium]
MYSRFIKKLRKKAGLTQGELAEKTGVSRSAVYDWESCKYPPTDANNIAALEDVFRLERGELYKVLQSRNPTSSPAVSEAMQENP